MAGGARAGMVQAGEATMQAATEPVEEDGSDTLPPLEPPVTSREGSQAVLVLLVEPAPLIRTFIRRALAVHGYQVVCASSVADAEVALLQRPALVITELNLADGSGDTVCRHVRVRLGTRVPVVLMSTGSEQELLRRAERCQADRCFSKLHGLSVLLPLVHQLALELNDAG